jgi:large subunit ribosomal protein L17
MRHLKAGKKLGRNASHRLALYRNLALALFRYERIITTLPKAKAVRPFVEKLITLARDGSLHARRRAISKLGPMANAEVRPYDPQQKEVEPDHRTIVQKLFSDLGPRFKDRPGGYTRVLKRHERRLGDAGRTAYLELLKEGESRTRTKQTPPPAPAPAPQVEETPAAKTETPAAEQSSGEQAPTTNE